MKKHYYILFLLLGILGNQGFAQTTINGGSVSGTWTKANSPYYVKANIKIDAGKTLTIEPGVKVQFSDDVGVYVRGQVKAEGAEADSIEFTVEKVSNFHNKWKTTDYGWRGFCLLSDLPDTDTTVFDYCTFSYICKIDSTGCGLISDAVGYISDSTRFVIQGLGVFCAANRQVKINHARFYNSRGPGSAVQMDRGGLLLLNSQFHDLSSIDLGLWRYTSVAGVIHDQFSNPENKTSNHYIIDNCKFYNIISRVIIQLTINSKNGFIKNTEIYKVRSLNQILPSRLSRKTIGVLVIKNTQVEDVYIHDITDSGQMGPLVGREPGCSFKKLTLKNIHFYDYDTLYARGGYSGFISQRKGNVLFEDVTLENCQIHKKGHYLSTIESIENPNFTFNRVKIINCDFGVTAKEGNHSFNNCLFVNNDSSAIRVGSNFRITNSLIANNGIGIVSYSSSPGRKVYGYVTNSIILGNSSPIFPNKQIQHDGNSNITFRNTIVQDGLSGLAYYDQSGATNYSFDTNNLYSTLPQFVNPTLGVGSAYDASKADWHLKSSCSGTSFGFNMGTETLANKPAFFSHDPNFNLLETDLDGNPRISCGKVDIGPYELQEYKEGLIVQNLIDTFSFCGGDLEATFLKAEVCTSPNSSYQWQVKEAGGAYSDVPGANKSSLQVLGLDIDKKWYRLKVQNLECGGSHTTDSSYLESKETPAINLGRDTILIDEESLVLGVTSSFSSYLWEDKSTNPTKTVGGIGSLQGTREHWLTVTASNGCKGSDTILVTIKKTDGIEDQNIHTIKLYPNPNNGEFSLYLPQRGVIQMTDLQGKKIWNQELEKGTWRIENKGWNRGTYFLHIQSSLQTKTIKLYIQ